MNENLSMDAFSSLTFHELHQYIVKLETESKRLTNELRQISKMNYVLENIAKSCQLGYSLLRKIEINKCCDCNEHLNINIRTSLNESIDESNVWLDQYEWLNKYSAISADLENEKSSNFSDTEESNDSSLSFQKELANYERTESNGSQSKSCCTQIICNDFNRIPLINTPFNISHQNLLNGNSKTNNIETTFDDSKKGSKNNTTCSCSECVNHITIESLEHKSNPNQQSFNKLYSNVPQKFRRIGPGRPPNKVSHILKTLKIGTNNSEMNNETNFPAFEDFKKTRYSGIGRYECPWPDCGYTPHFLRDLRRHIHKHTGNKKYKCDYEGCDFITVWKTSLLQHQRKKHNHIHVKQPKTILRKAIVEDKK